MSNHYFVKILTLFLAPIAFTGVAKAEPSSVTAVQPCELRAYVIDPDPNGLHVRARAGSSAPIAAVIPRDSDGTLVEIRGNVGDWLMMTHAETMGGKTVFNGTGWVYAPLLGTQTRANAFLYAMPNLKGDYVEKLGSEKEVILEGCRDTWAKAKYKGIEGWLPSESNCPNPVTTCP